MSWARTSDNGYEVSTKGDKRFSALVAKLPDGRTIEEAYQLDIKGYRSVTSDWREAKGKPPLISVNLWESYLALWREWANHNPDLINDLKEKSKDKVLTDMFAWTDISQARALDVIINET